MRNFLVQIVKNGNSGKTLDTYWETRIQAERYIDAVQQAAFRYLHHVRDIEEITVTQLGLWLYLVEENGFKSLYRIYNLDIETDI